MSETFLRQPRAYLVDAVISKCIEHDFGAMDDDAKAQLNALVGNMRVWKLRLGSSEEDYNGIRVHIYIDSKGLETIVNSDFFGYPWTAPHITEFMQGLA